MIGSGGLHGRLSSPAMCCCRFAAGLGSRLCGEEDWVPAYAGMTSGEDWVPAYAGMTSGGVQTLQVECLDHFLVFGEMHFD